MAPGAAREEAMTQAAAVEQRLAEVVSRHGPWTAHNIDLGHGVSTMGDSPRQDWRVDFFAALIGEQSGFDLRPPTGILHRLLGRGRAWRSLTMLDLACLEGLFAIEFARMGHRTVGIDVRAQHVARSAFARDVLGLSACRLVQADVRRIPADLTDFDVMLCAGILYHLDFPDVVRFLADIAARTRGLMVIDSHFAYEHISESVAPLSAMAGFAFEGEVYHGRRFVEHAPDVPIAERLDQRGWQSVDNDISVWLTEESVGRILAQAGFTLVTRRFPNADWERKYPDRPTLVFKRTQSGVSR